MKLRQLRYFTVVAEERNLTRAAERLHISQPPLTRQIRELEEHIGTALFTRLPRGLELTPAGEYLYPNAQSILDKIDQVTDATRRMGQSQTQRFGLAFEPSIFYGQLPTLVRHLKSMDNLHVSLHELDAAAQIEALRTGRINIGFGRIVVPNVGDDILQYALFQEPMLVALPSSHPLIGQEITLRALSQLPFIAYPIEPKPNFSDICLGIFAQAAYDIRIVQHVNEVQTALSLVASDMGFTLVPEQVKRVNREGVVFAPFSEESIGSSVVCCRRNEASDAVMANALAFLDQLVDNRLSGRYP
jgi:DNA-binding transcriptional LysR family regulator